MGPFFIYFVHERVVNINRGSCTYDTSLIMNKNDDGDTAQDFENSLHI